MIFPNMITNKFGEMVFSDQDLVSLVMKGHDLTTMTGLVVDNSVNTTPSQTIDINWPVLTKASDDSISVEQFHYNNQQHWLMPDEFKSVDIAAHVLSLCKTDAELQRVGEELLLFQERSLFDLLKYLHYLVNVMRDNNIIWGVGRGSSVASYVLYLLGVHRINSMFYDLDPREFLR